ncbi:uncharacterized protein LOC133513178 isoform X2 [Syngnathoides biaculeatus]|uniref:uncharacterized protein LOC133513178 isoform X2 n=1 Tax=Syngnathoides biaculeatus TaxID=300417 RepID=UPI002ADE3786|nr:uncharacterized protein LOC133513178 isoform X2 [Syngnathoides biaculeatus]
MMRKTPKSRGRLDRTRDVCRYFEVPLNAPPDTIAHFFAKLSKWVEKESTGRDSNRPRSSGIPWRPLRPSRARAAFPSSRRRSRPTPAEKNAESAGPAGGAPGPRGRPGVHRLAVPSLWLDGRLALPGGARGVLRRHLLSGVRSAGGGDREAGVPRASRTAAVGHPVCGVVQMWACLLSNAVSVLVSLGGAAYLSWLLATGRPAESVCGDWSAGEGKAWSVCVAKLWLLNVSTSARLLCRPHEGGGGVARVCRGRCGACAASSWLCCSCKPPSARRSASSPAAPSGSDDVTPPSR